jgi:hypothetical protein
MNRFLVAILIFQCHYVLHSQGDSLWRRKVLPSNLSTNAHFGQSVALYQNYFLIGAPGDSIYGSNSGSVYIIDYDDNNISSIKKLVPNDGQANDQFGYSVLALNNYIIIGAPGNSEFGLSSGAVYIFTYQNSDWIQLQKIFANNPSQGDYFGASLSANSVSGWLLIGAPQKKSNGINSGGVFLYIFDGNSWVYENELFPPTGNLNQRFGFTHDQVIRGLLIGAPGDSTYGTNSGAVYNYIYHSDSHNWQFISKNYAPQPHSGDEFGYSLDGDRYSCFIGSPGFQNVGKAYLYKSLSSGLVFDHDYQPNDIDFGDKVGFSVSLYIYNGGRGIIGIPGGSVNNRTGRASIIFTDVFGIHLKFYSFPQSGLQDDMYGYSVDNNFDYYLVGAPYNDDGGIDAGVVYLNKWIHWELPVELTSFTASVSQTKVKLNWQTATELNNQGFEVQRKLASSDWITIGFKQGQGTTTELTTYFYEDEISEINSNKLYYRLKQIDFDGTFTYSEEIEVFTQPLNFSISQNYPNPFNPNTIIKYEITKTTNVKIDVFDMLGRIIANIVNEEKSAGRYELEFDGSSLSSGVYYYRMHAGDFVSIRKMLMLK